jgi:hypothetical protein
VLQKAAAAHPDTRFIGLDVQDNDAAGRAFRKEFGVSYPSISDRSRERASRLGAVSTPATFAIDKGGVIRAQILGPVDLDIVECMLHLAGA